jgi:hypothetical protein
MQLRLSGWWLTGQQRVEQLLDRQAEPLGHGGEAQGDLAAVLLVDRRGEIPNHVAEPGGRRPHHARTQRPIAKHQGVVADARRPGRQLCQPNTHNCSLGP